MDVKLGTIVNVNGQAFTCSVIDAGQTSSFNNVALPGKYDQGGGSHAIQLPCDGAPCIYTRVGDQTYIINTYFPVNYSPDANLNGATTSRRPSDLHVGEVLQGDTVAVNTTGGSESFTGAMKKIVLSPDKLSSIWNLTNCIWSNVCNIFKLSASGFKVEAGSGEGGDCTTVFTFSNSVSGSPSVVVQVGNGPQDLEVSIEGQQVLHISADRDVTINARNVNAEFKDVNINAQNANICVTDTAKLVCPNVTLQARNLNVSSVSTDITSKSIVTTASTINVSADVVDMTACGAVKLP